MGEDSSVRDIHKMCTSDSESCINPREAITEIIVLEKGTYNDQPATKVLLRPHTGTYILHQNIHKMSHD